MPTDIPPASLAPAAGSFHHTTKTAAEQDVTLLCKKPSQQPGHLMYLLAAIASAHNCYLHPSDFLHRKLFIPFSGYNCL
jgi:hypothetical protein